MEEIRTLVYGALKYDDYVVKNYGFDEKRAQVIIQKHMKILIETDDPTLVMDYCGSFHNGRFNGILRRLIEEMYAKPEDCCLYNCSTRLYYYKHGDWTQLYRDGQDEMRRKFWAICLQWVHSFTNKFIHFATKPKWGLKVKIDPDGTSVTKKFYIENVTLTCNLSAHKPPISNSTMIDYLKVNHEIMDYNRHVHTKRVKAHQNI
jgi:hypothetical protein